MKPDIKPIVLRAPRAREYSVGVVRLSNEAEQVVRRLHTRSRLPISRIVSEIIIQSENLIDIDMGESCKEESDDT